LRTRGILAATCAALEDVSYWVARSARALSNIRKERVVIAENDPRQIKTRRVHWRLVIETPGR
jgi:adenylate kinase